MTALREHLRCPSVSWVPGGAGSLSVFRAAPEGLGARPTRPADSRCLCLLVCWVQRDAVLCCHGFPQ